MKAVTEFPIFKLEQGLKAQTALTTEGKTPEEAQASIGETFKMEGDKLKHFINALGVAGQNMEKLSRVLVVTFAEGEQVPPKAVKVEDHHYLPEFQLPPKAMMTEKRQPGGPGKGKPGGRGGGGKPKESPWGMSPEEKAAKKGKGPNKPT